MDRIVIEGLRFRCLVGIHPEERRGSQELCAHLTLFTNIQAPAESDSIGDAVDYQRISEKIFLFAEQSRRLLLETVAHDMARMILAEFPAVESIVLRVIKPSALPQAEYAGIEIERKRSDYSL